MLLRKSATAQAGRAAIPSRGCVLAWMARSRREYQIPQTGSRRIESLQHQGMVLVRTVACAVAVGQTPSPLLDNRIWGCIHIMHQF